MFFIYLHDSRYYWKSMVQDIDSFVKSCITCQRVNKKLHRMPAKLHPITHQLAQIYQLFVKEDEDDSKIV